MSVEICGMNHEPPNLCSFICLFVFVDEVLQLPKLLILSEKNSIWISVLFDQRSEASER